MVAAATVEPVDVNTKPKSTPNPLNVEAIKTPDSAKLNTPDLKSTGGRLSVAWGAVCEIGKDICKLVSERADRHKASVAVGQLKSLESLPGIDAASDPKLRDQQWKERSEIFRTAGHTHLAEHLEVLKGPAAEIERMLKTELETKLAAAKDVFSGVRPHGNLEIQDFLGDNAANTVASLTPDERKRFLAAYESLRSMLPDLKASLEELNQVPAKLNQQAIALVKSDASFADTLAGLHDDAKKFYEQKRQEIFEEHANAHGSEGTLASASDAIAAGDVALAALTKIQAEVQELSKSLSAAQKVSGKLETTLIYLKEGICGKGSALTGATDTSFVLVSEGAADAIADWVKQKTEAAVEGLNEAKAKNDPVQIAEAAKALDAVSGKVHEQLADVAGLLSKINKGFDQEGLVDTPGLRERIIAKARDGGQEISVKNEKLLSEYVNAVDEKLTGLVKDMFSADADLQQGRRKLEEFVVKHRGRVEALIAEESHDSDGLTSADIKEALSTAKKALDDTPKAQTRVERNAERYEEQLARELKDLEPKPKEGFFRRAWNSFWG